VVLRRPGGRPRDLPRGAGGQGKDGGAHAARDEHDKGYVFFEVRERGAEGKAVRYDMGKVPSPYHEDKWTGNDVVCYETGYEERGRAEKRARELNESRSLSEREDVVYEV
jgi:hypothetical protein